MKKVLAIFLTLALCLSCLPATVFAAADSGTCGDDLTWELTDDGILTISGTGAMFDYGTEYAPWYSYRDHIFSAVVEEGVTSIGSYAFHNCEKLASVTLPSNLTSIGEGAFSNCSSLTSIVIPEGVTSIGDSAFENCSSLTSIVIPEGVTSIEDYAFFGCSSLKKITFNGDAPSIGENAFCGVTATVVVCSENNETWTDDVLQNYGGTLTWITRGNVTSLELTSEPETRYIVGDTLDLSGIVVRAGYDTGYHEDIAADELTISDCDMSTAGRKTITISYGGMSVSFEIGVHEGKTTLLLEADSYPESAHNYADFTDETQTVTIPGYDRIILVFTQETQVESSYDWIYVYDGSDQQIAKYTGTQAAGVTVTVPGDTAKIRLTSDSGGNYYGYSFTSITGETFIHTGSAAGTAVEPTCTEPGRTAGKVCEICGGLFDYEEIPALGHDYADVVTPATPDEHGYTTHTCTRCGDSYVEYTVYGSTTVASGDFSENLRWCLTEDGELYIFGEGAMDNFTDSTMPWADYITDITSVVMESGVTGIGSCAFFGCENLTSVTIPEGVTSVGDDAFSWCSSLTSIMIPDSVTSIGNGAFWQSGLTSVIIPAGVTAIGNDTFSLTGLTSVTIPESVTSIGIRAFYRTRLTSVTIPESVTSIGAEAFSHTDLTSITIPDGVTVISEELFSHCTSLTSISIPEGVTSIGSLAFSACDGLTEIIFTGDAPTFDGDVFYGVTATAYYPADNTTWVADVMQNYGGTITWEPYQYAHTWGEWTVVTDPTCTEKGTETRTCADCGEIETRDVDALGHDYEAVVTAPTCEEQGYTTHTCTRCGDSYVDAYVEAKGHVFGEWITDGNTSHRTCVVCGLTENKASTDGGDVEIDIPSQSDENVDVDVDHVETSDERYILVEEVFSEEEETEVQVLKVFDINLKNEDGVHVQPDGTVKVKLPLGNHKNGNYKVYRIDDDGTRTDMEAKRQGSHMVFETDHFSLYVIVEEADHTHTYTSQVTNPTCMEKGCTTHTCSICGSSYQDNFIDATGHDYHSVVTDPTCTEEGYTTHICSRCDDSYVDTCVDATGHNYDKGTCTECGEQDPDYVKPTEPESVPVTPVKPVWQSWLEKLFGDWWGDEEEECDHEYASVITEPTCEEKGYTTHTCTKCGDTYKDSYTDALGHQYEDGICTQCGKTEPVKPAKPNWKDILEKLLEWWK